MAGTSSQHDRARTGNEPAKGARAPDLLTVLLEQARAGSQVAYVDLLKLCRRYLLSIANRELSDELRAKVAPSDLVQETLLEAERGFDDFRGHTQIELLAWLRAILDHNVADAVRHYKIAEKRRVDREVRFGSPSDINDPSANYADDMPTPAASLVLREQELCVEHAVEGLPDDYRTVIHLHHWEQLSFDEISRRMDRSAAAVRKLWYRAIERVRQEVLPSYGSRSH